MDLANRFKRPFADFPASADVPSAYHQEEAHNSMVKGQVTR